MRRDTAKPSGACLSRQEWHDQVLYYQSQAITRDEIRRQAQALRFITYAGPSTKVSLGQHVDTDTFPPSSFAKRQFPIIVYAGLLVCYLLCYLHRDLLYCLFVAVSVCYLFGYLLLAVGLCASIGSLLKNVCSFLVDFLHRSFDHIIDLPRSIFHFHHCLHGDAHRYSNYLPRYLLSYLVHYCRSFNVSDDVPKPVERSKSQCQHCETIPRFPRGWKIDVRSYKEHHNLSNELLRDGGRLLMEGLELLLSDKWFRRAWILQEASLTNSLYLVVHSSPELSRPSTIAVPNNILINERLIRTKITTLFGGMGMAEQQPRIQNDIWERFRRAVHDFHYSHPYSTVSNAAESVTLLATRDNTICSDRLAILANMCDYRFRIDTRNLQEAKYSLSAAVFTLALMNGDLSLLEGFYQTRPQKREVELNCYPDHFSWLPPDLAILEEVQFPKTIEADCRLIDSILTPHGLLWSGFCWDVDTHLVFPELQAGYKRFLSNNGKIEMEYSDYRRFFWDLLMELNSRNLSGLVDAVWDFVAIPYVWNGMSASYRYADDPNRPAPNLPARFTDLLEPNTSRLSPKYQLIDRQYHESIEADIFLAPHLLVTCGSPADNTPVISSPRVPLDEKFVGISWVVSAILKTGSLWCGRAYDSVGKKRLVAVFDIDGPGLILTPRYNADHKSGRPDWMKFQPISFITELCKARESQPDFSATVVRTNGLIRGMWNRENRKADRYLLT
ncbi:hypothetical protein F4824DRAFT_506123 [Ustulina deusta]|nr:hypothetical protein F4824DRAFT_506123 [Ustulina deusta]